MVNFLRITTAALSAGGGSFVDRADPSPCPRTDISCPANNNCLWTDPNNGAKFVSACSVDLAGGDLQTIQTKTYSDCLNGCAVTQNCVAVSFKNGFCYLKSSIKPAVSNTAVNAAQISGTPKASPTKTPSTFCGNTISCPANNNCIYGAGMSGLRLKPFVIACDRDYYGGDFKQTSSQNTAACVNNCALTTGCVAATYKNSTKECFLKNSIQPALYNSDTTGARLM